MNIKLFFKNFDKQKLIDSVIEATNKMFIVDKSELQVPTEKAKKLLDIITSNNFDNEESLIKLVEVITGENILTFYNKDIELICEPLAMFKVITDDLDNFNKGDICIITDENDFICINVENKDFDDIDIPTDENITIPSTDEISYAVDKLIKTANK